MNMKTAVGMVPAAVFYDGEVIFRVLLPGGYRRYLRPE